MVTLVDGSAAWSAKATVYPSLSDYLQSIGSPAPVQLTIFRDGASHQLSLTLPSR